MRKAVTSSGLRKPSFKNLDFTHSFVETVLAVSPTESRA